MAITTQGIQLFWSTSTVLSTAAGALIGEVTDISGPTGSRSEIEVTSLNSSAKEYLMALPDFGDISFNVNYTAGDTAQNAFYADSILATAPKRRGIIKFNDSGSHSIMFKGYAKQFSWTMGKDSVIKASAAVRITGPATLTTTIA